MKEIVNRVIELSREFLSKNRIHEAEHGLEGVLPIGSKKLGHFSEATRFLNQKLKSYLESLSEENLRMLETLMYFGRGDDDNFFRLHAYLRPVGPARKDVERTLLGKIPALEDYLTKALKKAEKLGLDIENPFNC
jgi:hypothetical protein